MMEVEKNRRNRMHMKKTVPKTFSDYFLDTPSDCGIMSADAGPSKKPTLTENLKTVQNQLDLLKKFEVNTFSQKQKRLIFYLSIFHHTRRRYLRKIIQGQSMQ